MNNSTIIVFGNTVKKTVHKWANITVPREAMWLERFKDSDRFPHLISVDYKNDTLVMTYCGEPISVSNYPEDWQDQTEEILKELKKYNCSHNDIKEPEVLVNDGKLMLVDFGWATEIGEEIPTSWPPNLGIEYRIKQHVFDDEFALTSAIKKAIWIIR